MIAVCTDLLKSEEQKMNCQIVAKLLSDYIDTDVLARRIIEIMVENAEQPEADVSFETAKSVWLNFLETEYDGAVERCLTYGQRRG